MVPSCVWTVKCLSISAQGGAQLITSQDPKEPETFGSYKKAGGNGAPWFADQLMRTKITTLAIYHTHIYIYNYIYIYIIYLYMQVQPWSYVQLQLLSWELCCTHGIQVNYARYRTDMRSTYCPNGYLISRSQSKWLADFSTFGVKSFI